MTVYTVGTFDLLHVGHLALLEYCRTLGDVVAVGVASDHVVNSYKPNVPVIPLEQRATMLKALRCVDIVRPYHSLEYVSGCRELDVDIFVIGEDWGAKPHNLAVESYLKSQGKQIIQVLYDARTSSTIIKKTVVAQSFEVRAMQESRQLEAREDLDTGRTQTGNYPLRSMAWNRKGIADWDHALSATGRDPVNWPVANEMVFHQRTAIMKKTPHTTEQIIRILREAEASGQKTEAVCRTHNLSAQTYYRWKSKYGGMDLKEAQRLRALEKENTELKKLLADQLLKTKALEIALEKNL